MILSSLVHTDFQPYLLPNTDAWALPGDKALELLVYLEQQGVRQIYCVPPVKVENEGNAFSFLKDAFQYLQQQYSGNISLRLSARYRLDEGFPALLEMTFEVGKKALDFLIANSGNRRNLEVDFFGGEPLMNWQVVKQLVEYGRSQEEAHNKKFRFTLTTNGVLLNDEIMEFCNREMSNVVLSLDGRKEVNDKMRPFRNGTGSYDLIVPKFQKFAEKRGDRDYFVRGTFTHNNLDFGKDVLHFADLGFKKMSVEPVVAPDEEPYAIKEADLPQILEEYDRLAAEYVKRHKEGRGFTFFHFMLDLTQGPCVAKRLSGCGSGTEYLAVTPWGDLYPCHQFVGNEDFLLGNVDTGVTNTAVRDEFKLCNVYAKDKCRDCFARFYCSGGCAANSYNFHGSITDAYDIGCEMQKKRIECAIMIKAALADGSDE